MLSERQAAEIENSAWFQTSWAPYVLVDAELRIRAANRAYERVTAHPRDSLIDQLLFDVFPDNPADPESVGTVELCDSFEFVFRRGTRRWMGLQRYDIPDRQWPGEFVYKVWVPVSSPIKDDLKTVAVVHHPEDVTRVVPATAGRERALAPAELTSAAGALGRQFPGLPAEAVLGMLTHSHKVIVENFGAPDLGRAEALARLRLESCAGHPAGQP